MDKIAYIALHFRVVEHRKYVNDGELRKTAIAQHSEDLNHRFNFDSALIHCPDQIYELDFWRTFIIHSDFESKVNIGKSVIPPVLLMIFC